MPRIQPLRNIGWNFPRSVLTGGLHTIVKTFEYLYQSTKPPPALNMPTYSSEEEAYVKWLQLIEKDFKDYDNLRSVKVVSRDKDMLR